ncbi:hypothetical protein FEV53_15000 [Palleronia caenipelagi]|uniref:Uncharacterized protein n=1 Tax=Palleronia caenipelagi TaxID=2489174 RepID=A0A547PP42_9RHOB|nr:hypothetical protein [Palleronia caenipelagi]TRD15890.1 hypothetical protein FEV53_15000 [Palleronia caenipelagi]
MPSRFAGQHVSLRACAGRIVLGSGQDVIAQHKRRFTRHVSYFEPWYSVPRLDREPGALRDGAPFMDWQLPEAMHRIREHYMAGTGGDRECVYLLLLARDHGIDVVGTACELTVDQNTLCLPAIINLINQLVEPVIMPLELCLRLSAANLATQGRLQTL